MIHISRDMREDNSSSTYDIVYVRPVTQSTIANSIFSSWFILLVFPLFLELRFSNFRCKLGAWNNEIYVVLSEENTACEFFPRFCYNVYRPANDPDPQNPAKTEKNSRFRNLKKYSK